jgi:WD40 repeat protein
MSLDWLDPRRSAPAAPPSLSWECDAPVTGLAFSRPGGHFAASLGDGTLRIIERGNPGSGPTVVAVHDGAVLTLQRDLAPNGFLSGGDDGRLVQTRTGGSRRTLLHVPGQFIDTIAVADTARAVALGREVRLLDDAGNEIGRTADHPSTVSGLAFNPKGKRLAVSHYGGVTLWWNTSIGGTPMRYRWRGSHIAISWSPDGKYLMTATQERELHGWRLANGSDIRMGGYAAKIRSFDWIAKPPYFVTAGADTVTAWSFAGRGPEGRPPFEFGQRPGILVTCVAAHPSRPLVAFGYEDGETHVAEVPGNRVIELRRGDGSKVTGIAWSANGAALATGTADGTVSLTELPPGGLW